MVRNKNAELFLYVLVYSSKHNLNTYKWNEYILYTLNIITTKNYEENFVFFYVANAELQ